MQRSRRPTWKKVALAGLLSSAALPAGARAAEATVSWTPDADRPIVGYRVYQATSSLLSLTTAQAALRGDVSRTDVALVPFVEAAGDIRAMVGALPAGMSLNYPAFPVITRTVDVNTSAQLSAAAAVAGSRIRVHAGASGGLNVNASDIEVMVDPGVSLGSLSIGNGVKRVHVMGGSFTGVNLPIPYDFNTSTERQDWTAQDVILDGASVTSANGMAIGMRGKRIAVLHCRLRALDYSIWGGDAKSVPYEDYIIADNTLSSGLDENTGQATLRLVSVLRSVTVDSMLTNTMTAKHNYRIHGSSSLNFAARNRLIGAGVLSGNQVDDTVGEIWFNQNTFYHTSLDLFNLGDNVHFPAIAHFHDNVAYSDHSFPGYSHPGWDSGNNQHFPYQTPPPDADFLSALSFRTVPSLPVGGPYYFRVTAVDAVGNESFFSADAGGSAAEGAVTVAGDALQLDVPGRFSWTSPPPVDATPPARPAGLMVR